MSLILEGLGFSGSSGMAGAGLGITEFFAETQQVTTIIQPIGPSPLPPSIVEDTYFLYLESIVNEMMATIKDVPHKYGIQESMILGEADIYDLDTRLRTLETQVTGLQQDKKVQKIGTYSSPRGTNRLVPYVVPVNIPTLSITSLEEKLNSAISKIKTKAKKSDTQKAVLAMDQNINGLDARIDTLESIISKLISMK